jgi:hypothetical protein
VRRPGTANHKAVSQGWADPGVFGTGVGPDYVLGGPKSVLYVGKSAGPLSATVGSGHDQSANAEASRKWMTERCNRRSAFWQFIELLDPTRRTIAWTNVCKMDRKGGDRPPHGAHWEQVRDVCLAALGEEITSLAPHTVLFATSGAYRTDVQRLLQGLGYWFRLLPLDDGWTSLHVGPGGARAIMTKHPQGWPAADRKKVIELLKDS